MKASRVVRLISWAAVGASTLGGIARAEESLLRIAVDIRAQPLSDALNALASLSGLQVLYPSELGKHVIAPRVQGMFSPEEALHRLLQGSGLRYEFINPKLVTIRAGTQDEGVGPEKTSDMQIGGHSGPWLLARLQTNSLTGAGASQGQRVAESAASEPAAAPQPALEEIIVTAQKRAENIQEVPIAITAIIPETIESERILSTMDLTNVVPGVTFTSITGSQLPSIRGIGTNLGQTTVAVYLDGVATDGVYNLLGIERVEVLKGPQGTYFGGQAVSGAISYVTRTPKQETEVSSTLGFGNYSLREFSGYLSGGVNDKLAAGIYLAGSTRNEYITHLQGRTCVLLLGYESCEPAHATQWGVRLKAVYKPWERLKVTGSFESQQADAFGAVAFRQIQPNAIGFALGAPRIIQPYAVSSNWAQYSQTRKDLSILRADLDLTHAQFVSLTGYRVFWDRRGNDIDGTAAPLVGTVGSIQYSPNHTFSEEMQLLSPSTSRWQWVLGLYYTVTPGNLRNTTPQVVRGAPAPVIASSAEADSKTYAEYAQLKAPLDWLTDGLALTLAGRYTREQRWLQARTQFLTLDGSQVRPPIWSPSATLQNSHTYTQFTPQAILEYRLGENLLYAEYGKGFVPGSLGSGLGVSPVEPETLNAYEIGMKSDLTPRLRLNTSAYYYDYTNSQLTVFVINSAGATGTKQVNTKGETSYGLESELTAAVTSGLKLSVNGSYIHAYYKETPNFSSFVFAPVGNVATPTNITGRQAIRAPKWVGNLGIDYTRPLPVGGSLNLHGSYQYNSGYPWDPAGLFSQHSYNWVTASVGYTSGDGRWRFSLWGDNLTGAYTENALLTTVFGTFVTDGAPRTYGASLRYSFFHAK